jgi:S1-C subfamily serine protease
VRISSTIFLRTKALASCALHKSLLALALAAPTMALATEIGAASEATVFIRAIGVVHAERQQPWKESRETRDVEFATGSGFVVSPAGYLLTNHHVVSGDDLTLERDGRPLRVKLEVQRIEVVFPADGTRLEARVLASDPDLDLAVLAVNGAGLPTIELGDSDAVSPGQPVQVIGFPLGRSVEVGRPESADVVPDPTVSRGTVAALRASDAGESRYIQTDASVHPGSSGGPMLDEHGYAVGVVRMALRRSSGLAFAIPINRVKDFLESNGLDRVFPTRRLTLGPVQSFDQKRVRLRVPDRFDDSSRSRLRLEWQPPEEVAFVLDRVHTPLPLTELEAAVVSGRAFPGFASSAPTAGRSLRLGGRPALMGWARGSAPSSEGEPLELGYAIVDLGKEKVVARYFGPVGHVAFNRATFAGSLQSLEADPMLTDEVVAPVSAVLEPASLAGASAPPVLIPRGWYREPIEASSCRDLQAPDAAMAASPEGDFTVSFRAAWWRSPGVGPEQALAACGPPHVAGDPASYAIRQDRLGVTRSLEGSFAGHAGGLWQLEMEAPASKQPALRELFQAWLAAMAAQDGR